MSRPSVETARGWQAKPVVGRDGEPLGRITHIYIDRSTGEPTWALVARGRLARKEAFVPLALASDEGNQVRVLVAATAVEEAPHVKAGGELSGDDEVRLSEHYGEPTGAPSTRSGARRGFLGGQPDLGEPGAAPEWATLPAQRAGARRSRARRLARLLSLAAFVCGVAMALRWRRRGDLATTRHSGRPMGARSRGLAAWKTRGMGGPMAGPRARRMGPPAAGRMGRRMGRPTGRARGRPRGRPTGPMRTPELAARVVAGSRAAWRAAPGAARRAGPKAAVRRGRARPARRARRARPGKALFRRIGVSVAVTMAAIRARRKRRSVRRSRQMVTDMRRQGMGMRRRITPSMPSMPSMPSVSMPSVSMPTRSHARRRSTKMRGKLRFAVGFAAGYVLGAKAGRERYEQIMRQVKDLLERPEVQDIAAKGRETIGQGAQRGAGVATDQMERVRAAMSSSHEGSAGPEPARGADATAKASGKDEPQRQPSSATPRPEQPPSPPA